MTGPTCDYCRNPAVQTDGTEIYPHRPDLKSKVFWICRDCEAYVGCHPGTETPLGRLADAELRTWKQHAHRAFDPYWKGGKMTRSRAYRKLSRALGIPIEKTHIGMFSVDECRRVVVLCGQGAITL